VLGNNARELRGEENAGGFGPPRLGDLLRGSTILLYHPSAYKGRSGTE